MTNTPANNSDYKEYYIMHDSHTRESWILLPIGYYYNVDIQRAKIGDRVLFSDNVSKEIEYIKPITINDSLTGFLCKKTYGVSLTNVMKRWYRNAEYQGYTQQSIHKDRCLLIFLKEE